MRAVLRLLALPRIQRRLLQQQATEEVASSRTYLKPRRDVLDAQRKNARKIYAQDEQLKQKRRLIDETTELAKNLLKLRAGTFTKKEYDQAKEFLKLFRKHAIRDSTAIAVSISLLERTVYEYSSDMAISNVDDQAADYLCEPTFFNPLLDNWKETAKLGREVLPPETIAQKLKAMSTLLENFRYNIVTIGILLDVLVRQSHPSQAPLIAEELLASNAELKPDIYICNQVLQAWAVSGLPEAQERMKNFMQRMQKDGCPLNVVSYTILLRCLGPNKLNEVESILKTMTEQDKIKPDVVLLTQAIYMFAQEGNIRRAEELLDQLLKMKDHREYAKKVGESTQYILQALRDSLSKDVLFGEKQRVVEKAEILFKKAEKHGALRVPEGNRLVGTLMDIFGKAGVHEKVEEISKLVDLDTVQWTVLLKSLGKSDMADRAILVLKSMLREGSQTYPTITTFNVTINACAESTSPNALNWAFEVMNVLKKHPTSLALGLKPNQVTYGSLMKCIANSKVKDAGLMANRILDEMDFKYQQGDENSKPDAVTYTIAVKACMKSGDMHLAETTLKRFESSDEPPNIRTYADILNHWASLRNPIAAESAEKILDHMNHKAEAGNVSLKPNIFCYNMVLAAWMNSGSNKAAENMWRIYEGMLASNISPNIVTYNTLIPFFASTNHRFWIKKADFLLALMESNNDADILPDYRHFIPVMKSWLEIGEPYLAQIVLQRRVATYRSGRNPDAKPAAANFELVIRGHLEAKDLLSATELLKEMEELYNDQILQKEPSRFIYQAVLKAWEGSDDPNRYKYISELEKRMGIK